MKNKLEKIFEVQKEFQHDLNKKHKMNIDLPIDRADYFKHNVISIIKEATEVLDCYPWKYWKQHQELNIEHMKEEIIDVFHFVVNLALFTGMDAEDFFYKFMEKQKINRERQKNGY